MEKHSSTIQQECMCPFRMLFLLVVLGVRFGEHKGPSKPVGKHLRKCNALQYVTLESVEILASTTRSERYLFTLEALWQKEERPKINTKDEFKRHELTIMWWLNK